MVVERLRHSPPLPPVSSTPVGAARSRPGRQVGDPYQAQKLLACSNQRDPTCSPFTLTYYLRPRRWAMPGGLGEPTYWYRVGSVSVCGTATSRPRFQPWLVTGRVRALAYRYGVGSVSVCGTADKKSLADWRDFSICVGITYLPGKSPCKYCRRR